jgi:peptide/nickel transport system permease protein
MLRIMGLLPRHRRCRRGGVEWHVMTASSDHSASAWRRLLADPQAVLGLLLVAAFVILALAAPRLAPLDPYRQFPEGMTATGMPRPPGTAVIVDGVTRHFLLGTDALGRDQLSRLLFGARLSLAVGLLAMTVSLLIGAGVGLLSGYFRGWVEVVLMRATDIMLTIPTLILAIALVAVLPRTPVKLLGATIPREIVNVFLVIGLVSWTSIARVVRGETMRVSSMEYIEAARALGCSHGRILLRHVLPNVLPTIVVLASLGTAGAIVLDAGLSYLGIGIQPPLPSWGKMIFEGQPYLVTARWMILAPGLAVVLVVLGFNLLGNGLQSALDPHRRGRNG